MDTRTKVLPEPISMPKSNRYRVNYANQIWIAIPEASGTIYTDSILNLKGIFNASAQVFAADVTFFKPFQHHG